MKRFLLSAIAGAAILIMPSIGHAADLPRAAPPAYVPAMVPVYNWTGFYLGGKHWICMEKHRYHREFCWRELGRH